MLEKMKFLITFWQTNYLKIGSLLDIQKMSFEIDLFVKFQY